MANLKNIRSKIKSVTSIQKVTRAMKMVAAAKLRKSQENMEKARPYSNRIKGLISHLIDDVDSSLLPLLNKYENIMSAEENIKRYENNNLNSQSKPLLTELTNPIPGSIGVIGSYLHKNRPMETIKECSRYTSMYRGRHIYA